MPTARDTPAPSSLSQSSSDARDAPVRSLMRAGVISVSSDSSICQVQRALIAHRVHAVLVVDEHGGRPAGWATARGVLEQAASDVDLLPAAAAVVEPVVVISPSASAGEALSRMLHTGAVRLLVCREPGGQPEGVLTEMDLLAQRVA